MFVTLTSRGYVKRMPISHLPRPAPRRPGVVGARRSTDEDYVAHSTIASTHSDMLFFTNRGRVFRLRTHEIPDVKRQAKGMPVINLIELDQRERVTALIDMESFGEEQFLVMVTKLGQIKKTPAAAYSAVRRNGLIAINLQDNDELNWVRVSSGGDEMLVVTRQGKSCASPRRRCARWDATPWGCRRSGCATSDEVAGFDIVNPDGHVLVVTEKGYGKLTPVSEYPSKGRNVQGMYTIDQTLPKIGEIVGMRVVEDLTEELMVISTMGQVIRIPLEQVSVANRQTQGVIIMRLTDDDRVGSMAGVGSPGRWTRSACLEFVGDARRPVVSRILAVMTPSGQLSCSSSSSRTDRAWLR